jgi:hypothetical protein
MNRALGAAAAGVAALAIGCGGGSSDGSSNASPKPASANVRVGNVVTGRFNLAMSTSFQPAAYDSWFFGSFPTATTPLGNLAPRHIRLQPLFEGVPQRSARSWDFAVVDAFAQPVLGVGDRSPEFQVAVAPEFMYDANHDFVDPTYRQFAGYAQNLVRYYNRGGFSAPDGRHASPSGHPITWWGIHNEPNINGVSAQDYPRMYNTLVPAMRAVDPSLKFMALELADFGDQEQQFVPSFVQAVTAPVDVLATHFYSTCNQTDNDQQIFGTVPGFADGVRYIDGQLKTKPALASVPIWITENNVNADYDAGNGQSACNAGHPFVTDRRGSSAFFAAWRPLVFSALGKAGAQALYHWAFQGDAQFGEFDDTFGRPRLSYWVDYWLAHLFPAPLGADLLQFTTDTSGIEVLPVRSADGSVVVMVVNYAVAAPGDNDGKGVPRTVAVDVSALGPFGHADVIVIDGQTDPVNGPAATPLGSTSTFDITLPGYGVAFVRLVTSPS